MSDDESLTVLLSGASFIFFMLVVQNGATFLAKVAIGRFLGRSQFGAISVGVTVLTFITAFCLLGMDSAVGRFLPRKDKQSFKQRVFVSSAQVVAPITVVTTFVFLYFNSNIAKLFFDQGDQKGVLLIFILSVPFAVTTKFLVGAMQGLKKSQPKALLENLLFPVSRFGFVAIALLVGGGVVAVASAYVAAYILTSIVGVGYLIRRTTLFERLGFDNRMHRTLLEFSLPLMIATSMLLIHRNIDVLLLGYFTNSEVVGVYSVAYTLAALLLTSYRAFSFIFMPVFSEAHSDNNQEQMAHILKLGQKWTLFASLPVFLVFVFLPGFSIRITFGTKFVVGGGATTLTVIAAGFLTQSLVGLNGYALNALGETRTVMWDTVAVASTNLIFNIALIPLYGALGAAIATAASFLLLNILYTYQLYTRIGVVPLSWVAIRTAAIGTLAVGGALTALSKTVGVGLPAIVASSPGFGILYLLIVIRYGGISEAEFSYLDSIEKKFNVDLEYVRRFVRSLQPR